MPRNVEIFSIPGTECARFDLRGRPGTAAGNNLNCMHICHGDVVAHLVFLRHRYAWRGCLHILLAQPPNRYSCYTVLKAPSQQLNSKMRSSSKQQQWQKDKSKERAQTGFVTFIHTHVDNKGVTTKHTKPCN